MPAPAGGKESPATRRNNLPVPTFGDAPYPGCASRRLLRLWLPLWVNHSCAAARTLRDVNHRRRRSQRPTTAGGKESPATRRNNLPVPTFGDAPYPGCASRRLLRLWLPLWVNHSCAAARTLRDVNHRRRRSQRPTTAGGKESPATRRNNLPVPARNRGAPHMQSALSQRFPLLSPRKLPIAR